MMILMSVIVVIVDYDNLFYNNINSFYSSFNNRNINWKRNVPMKRIIIYDKLDSRLDNKFIFFKFWQWHSDICINNLSNQANEYFKN